MHYPVANFFNWSPSTLIKKKIKFSSYLRKFTSGEVAKSYMRKGFLIYEKENLIFFYISVGEGLRIGTLLLQSGGR
jgi:hypothetical protein